MVVAVALLDFSSVLAHFLLILGRVLSIRLHSHISDWRDPVAGGPRDAPGNHLQIEWIGTKIR